MTDLSERKCIPCSGGIPALSGDEISALKPKLDSKWHVVNNHHLSRSFKFNNFAAAISFVNLIGEVAENENHHPEIQFGWGYANIEIWTHKIDGLTESDFILAAKIDQI